MTSAQIATTLVAVFGAVGGLAGMVKFLLRGATRSDIYARATRTILEAGDVVVENLREEVAALRVELAARDSRIKQLERHMTALEAALRAAGIIVPTSGPHAV